MTDLPQVTDSKQSKKDRKVLFLSHANPEENEFARWLSSQLTIAGYQVWCDVTDLLGGEKFWTDIEDAIETATFRFLFVATLHTHKKAGCLRELQSAQKTQAKHQLKDFIVPLKIDQFPFGSMCDGLANLNMVRFDTTWSEGLRQLLSLLEREQAPRFETANASAVTDWYQRSIDSNRREVISKDNYLSNWFELKLPTQIAAYRFNGPTDALPSVARSFPYPCRVVDQHLLTFASTERIVEELGDYFGDKSAVSIATTDFIREGSVELGILRFDAQNMVSDLIRQAWEAEMHNRKLLPADLASGPPAWYFKNQQLPKNKAFFTRRNDKTTYRQLVGAKTKKTAEGTKVPDGFWHYAVSALPKLYPSPHLVLKHHVIFTDDGETPWEKPDRMHRARRGVCRNWWNAEWRDRLLAFCSQMVSADHPELSLLTGGEQMLLSLTPVHFSSPWTYFEDKHASLDEAVDIELVEEYSDEQDEGDLETGENSFD